MSRYYCIDSELRNYKEKFEGQVGELLQLVKCLPPKHQNLRLGPQHAREKPGSMYLWPQCEQATDRQASGTLGPAHRLGAHWEELLALSLSLMMAWKDTVSFKWVGGMSFVLQMWYLSWHPGRLIPQRQKTPFLSPLKRPQAYPGVETASWLAHYDLSTWQILASTGCAHIVPACTCSTCAPITHTPHRHSHLEFGFSSYMIGSKLGEAT